MTSSPVQLHPGPSPFSDWTGCSLATPRSSVSSAPRQLDSSFCSEFSPLPPSPPRTHTHTHTHTPPSLEEMLKHTQDLPLPLKLQQLRQWQQHMQEQLKAHQRDQQRLLGMELPEAEGSMMDSLPTTPQHDTHCTDGVTPDRFNDRPIRPGLGVSAYTFEELLEEQLKLEEQKGKTPVVEQKAGPKRSFLRKGEGLIRFNPSSSKPTAQNHTAQNHTEPQAKYHTAQNRTEPHTKNRTRLGTKPRDLRQNHTHINPTEPKAGVPTRPNQNSTEPLIGPKPSRTAASRVQRKTATLGSHTHSAAAHTRAPTAHTHSAAAHTHSAAAHTPTPAPCRDPVAMETSNEVWQQERLRAPVAMETSFEVWQQERLRAPVAMETSFEVWQQERLRAPVAMETSFEVWQHERRRERRELGEFELLEAAAEEESFSSCSSSFLHTLRSSHTHTLTHTHTRRLSSTPIKTHTDAATTGSHTHTHTSEQPLCLSDDDEDDGTDEDDEMTQVSPSSHCLPVAPPPYDSCPYQEPEEAGQGEESAGLSDMGEVEFDDDDTWAETSQHSLQPERTLKRKVAMAKGVESFQADEDGEAPPTSQLIAKLFPALQPKPRPPPVTQTSPQPISSQESEGVCEVMRERLVQLELEIERFRMERADLARLRTSLHSQQEELRKEKAEFEAWRSQTEAEWAESKQAEMKKLQRDRKLFEKHSAAARNTHTSALRDEQQAVKQQVCVLQEECVRKEQRWKNTHTRLQQQIHTLTTHNQELLQQIHTLENLRLTAWRTQQEERRGGQQRKMELEEERRGGQQRKEELEEERRGGQQRKEEEEERRGGQQRKEEQERDVDVGGASSPPERKLKTFLNRTSPKNGIRSSHEHSFGGNSGSPTSNSVFDVTSTEHVCDDVTSGPELHTAPGVHLAIQHEEEFTHPDGKVERVFKDGSRVLVFPNGTQKLLSADGSAKVTFFNGDVKEVCPDQRVVYYFADAQTTHTTFPDGTELLQFPNSQTEKLYPDGKKEIVFPDQTLKTLHPDGREESVLPDGTIIRLNGGVREVVFVSGEREEHTAEWRRRVYTDGTQKTIYTDGRQATHYASGRVRIKDSQGRIVKDTHTH